MNSLQHWELDHLRLELSCLYPSHTLATDLGVDFDTIARNCRGRSQAPWAEFDDSHWRLTAARAPRRGGMNTEHLSDQAQGHLLTTARDWNMVIERALLILHGATPTTTINPSVSKNAVGARDALYEAELSARDDHFAPMVILRLAYRYGETYAAHALAQGRSAAALIYLEYYGSLCDLMPVLPAGVSNDELFEKHTTLIFQTLAQAATYACMCARTHFVTPAVLSVATAVRYWTSLLRVSTTPHSGAHAALSVISPLRAEKLDIWNDKTRPYPVGTWADLVNPQTRLKNDFLTYVQRCTDGVRKIFFTQFDKEAERSAWFLDVEPRLATHPVDGRQLNDIVTQATGDPQDGDLWIDIEETFVNYVTADAGPNGERLYRKL